MIESDGLLVRNVRRTDAGTYTCRARFVNIYKYLKRKHRKDQFKIKCCDRVPQTGELEERDIRLDVQVGQAILDGHCLEKIDFFYLTSKYKMIIKCSVSF